MARLIFEGRRLGYAYPGVSSDAVRDVSVDVRAGETVALVGPNGSGKTTLLRLLLGLLSPRSGMATLVDRPVDSWTRGAFARTVGVVTQREEPAFPMRVREAVLHGRYAHMGAFAPPQRSDWDAVAKALARCDVRHLARRWIGTLSGGEWQRVRIARALAQEPIALVLDEPTTNLDIRHEMEVFELVTALVQERDLAAIVVTHHVNLAARFADRLVVMHEGRARALGRPEEVLTRELVETVFEWPMAVATWRGKPQLIPRRKDEEEES